jgi:hypothetical protein
MFIQAGQDIQAKSLTVITFLHSKRKQRKQRQQHVAFENPIPFFFLSENSFDF